MSNDYSVGESVIVKMDDGRLVVKTVKYEPWQLDSGTWVIGLEGIRGGYALSRVIGRANESNVF